MNDSSIGIDIGGTSIKGGLVNLSAGTVTGEVLSLPTPKPATRESVAEGVAQVAAGLCSKPRGPVSHLPAGVTFPGIIRHGEVHSAANLDSSWVNTKIDTFLSERLDRRVEVINDADAAGLAEARYGAGAGTAGSILVITLGTGIGSAFIFDGKLVPNAELGHLEIDGFVAEAKASAVARERDGLTWEDYSLLLQRYFSYLEFLFSPELFIIGGGISQRADEFLPRLNLKTPIVPATLRNEAGIVGAAMIASQKQTTGCTESHQEPALAGP